MKNARDIMTRTVKTVTRDMPLNELARLFCEERVAGFPVTDDSGKLVGIITESDLIHQNQRLHIPTTVAFFDAVVTLGSSKKLEDDMRRMVATTVGEVMTPDPIVITEETPVSEVAALMSEKHIHTIPVTDDDGEIVGVIGKVDVIRGLAL